MTFKNFFYSMLGFEEVSTSKKLRRIKIRRIKKKSDKDSTSASSEVKEYLRLRNKIAVALTRGIIIAFFVSLGAIIYFGIVEKQAPPILSQIISGTIGFFSGAITAFMRFPDQSEGK